MQTLSSLRVHGLAVALLANALATGACAADSPLVVDKSDGTSGSGGTIESGANDGTSGSNHDTGVAIASDPSDAGCVGESSTIGKGCPATLLATTVDRPRGSIEGAPACNGGEEQWIGRCDTFDVFRSDFSGLTGFECAYDPTSHKLVGALQFTDVYSYCGGTAAEIRAGQFPPGSCWNSLVFVRQCP